MLSRLDHWLGKCRDFFSSWDARKSPETSEGERSLLELPVELNKKLVDSIENLPSNPADTERIVSKIEEAYKSWHEEPKTVSNSLVILSSPVTGVSKILTETLEEWTRQKQLALKLLPFATRPLEIDQITSQLKTHLATKSTDGQPEIVLIPDLGWCFLRSLEGLSGIEYLRSLICQNSSDCEASRRHRFWIIGGGKVAWEYLNYVCALEAYCGEVFALPKISPEETQKWLNPLVEELEITFEAPRLDKKILEGDKDNKTSYFERLTDISQGVSTIAERVFMQSIYYQKLDSEAQNQPENKTLVARTPKLKSLPSLQSGDLYILYSLLLHGDLTITALAASLGDEEAEVQARIQLLQRGGIVEQREQVLQINPIYYPQLKKELASNNFIISS